MDVVLVGFGFAGEFFHAPLIRATAGLRLRAVVTSKAKEFVAERLGPEVAVVGSMGEAKQLTAVNDCLVVIAAPNGAHFALAEEALLLGCHVVIDKPMVPSLDQGQRLVALARARQLKLTVFQNRRYDSDFLTVKRLISDGSLGQVRYFSSTWKRFRPEIKQGWRWNSDEPASGLLWDLGSHMFDQCMVLFGGMPLAVTCVATAQRHEGAPVDYFSCHLEFPQHPGLVCRVESGCLFRPATGCNGRSFEIHGTHGSFLKPQGIDTQEDLMKSGAAPSSQGTFGIEPESDRGTLIRSTGEQVLVETERGVYVEFYASLARAIAHDEAPPVDSNEGLNVVRLVLAAEESARTGKRVVL